MRKSGRPSEQTRIAVIRCVCLVCLVLALIGLIAFLWNPAAAKDLWPIIASIESAALAVLSALLGGKEKG